MSQLPARCKRAFLAVVQLRMQVLLARFEDIPRADRLPKEIVITVPEMPAEAGADKITFVGEPTLCPYLGDRLPFPKTLV